MFFVKCDTDQIVNIDQIGEVIPQDGKSLDTEPMLTVTLADGVTQRTFTKGIAFGYDQLIRSVKATQY